MVRKDLRTARHLAPLPAVPPYYPEWFRQASASPKRKILSCGHWVCAPAGHVPGLAVGPERLNRV